MDQQTAFIQSLTASYPRLAVDNARWHNKDGQYNHILLVGDDLIFRFPRYPEGIAALQREVRLLRGIQGVTTLPIPNPIFANLDAQQPAHVFMGYRLIPGEPLWRPKLQEIDDHFALDHIAAQLARFLQELHAFPLQRLPPDLPVQHSAAWAEALYADIRTHLFRFMRPDARRDVAAHFETALSGPHLRDHPLTLTHGDFGGSNILYDPRTLRVTGVIDFGFAAIADPAADLAAVSTFGDPFLTCLRPHYPALDAMLPRIEFYKGTFALQEALHGIKNDDQSAFQSGIAPFT